MSETHEADFLNRSVKLAMDNGDAATLDDARAMFQTYRLQIVCSAQLGDSPTLQAALLTIVNTSARCFIGGVLVFGCPDAPLLAPWEDFETLHPAVASLNGSIVGVFDPSLPTIQLGTTLPGTAFNIRLFYNGWNGGVVPVEDFEPALESGTEFILSGIAAGAIAVSEAFQHIRKSNITAGQRSVGVSLFEPGEDFLTADAGPELSFLPSDLWLIGLGHIGQALLWSLGLLPYEANQLRICLQDFDVLSDANKSTSPLTFASLVGLKKTRTMAAWCDRRGFDSIIIERSFRENFRVAADEPQVALCAVDNALARSVLEQVGFQQVIEGGLGSTADEYLAIRLHTFPGETSAAKLWETEGPQYVADEILAKPAYVSLLAEGEDPCGITLLAGKAVGAAFVGTFLSTLMLGELLRQLHGAPRLCVIDGTLRSTEMSAFKSEFDVAPISFVQVFVTDNDSSLVGCNEVVSADLAELRAGV
jgi:hypothetical protein